jgi:hypothetical protein
MNPPLPTNTTKEKEEEDKDKTLHPETDDPLQTITTLWKEHENDPYILQKINQYVAKLPLHIETTKRNHENRQQSNDERLQEQETFIQSFLNNNQYFYVPTTDKFFYYDGVHYQYLDEDKILYNILSSISRYSREDKGGNLMTWKQKTKVSIMKRIKENALFSSIPESGTIQNVIDLLYPALFSTRNEAKYFLCILGDTLFKKRPHIIHYIHPHAKTFLRELNTHAHYIY